VLNILDSKYSRIIYDEDSQELFEISDKGAELAQAYLLMMRQRALNGDCIDKLVTEIVFAALASLEQEAPTRILVLLLMYLGIHDPDFCRMFVTEQEL
jgi:hypothetical protein